MLRLECEPVGSNVRARGSLNNERIQKSTHQERRIQLKNDKQLQSK